jgi:hypothetical protein
MMIEVNGPQGLLPDWHINNLKAFFNALQQLHKHLSGVHITFTKGNTTIAGWQCSLVLDTGTGKVDVVKAGDTYFAASGLAVMEAVKQIGKTPNQYVQKAQ